MPLPLAPPLAPMEALAALDMPRGGDWRYEPKWDGFRCLAFRDGSRVSLHSKAGRALARYFPDVIDALGRLAARRFVIDGELIVERGGHLSFDDLLMRIHPAASRVRALASETPATFIIFDMLADDAGALLTEKPLSERRRRLEAFAQKYLKNQPRLKLSPQTPDFQEARRWFRTLKGGLDGVVAKRAGAPYEIGLRSGAMRKIKNWRSADCVVGGFRYAEKKKVVGSLLLGLYNDDGLLDHVGFTSSMPADSRPALTKQCEALVQPPGFTGKAPGGPSRWSTRRSSEWNPLSPKLVVEVQYDHFTGGRFRHGTRLLRWRPDKAPRQCTLRQVAFEAQSPLKLLAA
jgi:ATP-dependent DNA ligase